MKQVTLAITGALLYLAAGTPAAQDGPVTVAEVLAAPTPLEGRIVQVTGYLRPHVLYLFPNRALAEERNWSAALIVGDDPAASIRSSPCPGRFVEMTGTFRQLDPGIYGLTDIRLIRLTDGDVCWPADPPQ